LAYTALLQDAVASTREEGLASLRVAAKHAPDSSELRWRLEERGAN
jgi:hypothetical protein